MVRECVAFCCVAATQAKWYNKGTMLVYASAECCPPLCGHRGFPFKGSVARLSVTGGLGLMVACLPMAIVGFLSALYQSKVACSGIALVAKRPEESGKAIILTVMVETYAVLALLVSLLGVMMPATESLLEATASAALIA